VVIRRKTAMHKSAVAVLFAACLAGHAWALPRAQEKARSTENSSSARRPVIYVMPNALTHPGSSDNSQVVVGSSHDGKEPQVAKVYQELQRRKECQGFTENMIKDKADYFLLLQHGGGKGNRWAVSDEQGNVIASGDSILLGNSVKDVCLAIGKDWQQRASQK
jgi:endonuclease/exonuclease/phosphatase (EEP) superfamily protein YafD